MMASWVFTALMGGVAITLTALVAWDVVSRQRRAKNVEELIKAQSAKGQLQDTWHEIKNRETSEQAKREQQAVKRAQCAIHRERYEYRTRAALGFEHPWPSPLEDAKEQRLARYRLAKDVRAFLDQQNMTNEQLAKLANVSRGCVYCARNNHARRVYDEKEIQRLEDVMTRINIAGEKVS